MEFIMEHWLAILLTLIALAFTLFVASYYGKREWNVAHLTVVYNPVIRLLHSFTDVISDLKFTYKDAPVSTSFCALVLSIVNTGKRDIRVNSEDGPFKILLPKDYKWESCETYKRKVEETVTAEIPSEGTMSVKWKLLKSGEAISILGLVDEKSVEKKKSRSDLTVNLGEKIRFEHRFPDTNVAVRSMDFNKVRDMTLRPFIKRIMLLFIAAVILNGGLFVVRHYLTLDYERFVSEIQKEDNSSFQNDGSEDISYKLPRAVFGSDSTVTLSKEFLNLVALKAQDDQLKDISLYIWMMSISFAFLIIIEAKRLRVASKEKKLFKMILKS